MRLEIEDFIEESDTKNYISKESKLKKGIKSNFDSFYKNYTRVAAGQKLPEVQLNTLQTMLLSEATQSSTLAVVECDQIWQQVALSCGFVESGIKKSIRFLNSGQSEPENEDFDSDLEGDFDEDEDDDMDQLDEEGFEDDVESIDVEQLGDNEIRQNSADDADFERKLREYNHDDDESEVSEDLNFADENVNFSDESIANEDGVDYDQSDIESEAEIDLLDNDANLDDTENDGTEKGKKKKESVFEDDFLKIDELEAFLDQEDAKDERMMKRLENPHMYHDDDEASDDDENENTDFVDYFSSIAGAEDDSAKYSDFFDLPSGKGKNKGIKGKPSVTFAEKDDYQSASDNEPEHVPKKRKFNLFGGDNESDNQEDDEGKSGHEKRMEKYREKIEQLEEQSLAEKPWQLMGEATADHRPADSLLAENLAYDSSARLPPEITTEKTLSLEQIVLQRVKDKTFDDVVRKFRPAEQPFEYRKRILLEQDKSKVSLAEVYEQEFLKQVREEKVEEKNEKHEEIRELMKKVFYRLDMLSHFSLTPQEPTSEMKIVKNAPAVTMEETVPVTLSTSAQLAPEEVRKVKKSEGKALNERTKTDKLRHRRWKKARQKAIARHEEKKLAPDSEEKAMLDLKKAARGNRNLKIVSDTKNTANVTGNMTSTSFFSQLSDKQNSKDLGKVGKAKNKNSDEKKAAKFKL